MENPPYRCVTCLIGLDRVLKQKPATLLKCDDCSKEKIQFADEYFEYPPLIIMLDLLLLREKAFREREVLFFFVFFHLKVVRI